MPLTASFKKYYSHKDVGVGGDKFVKAFNIAMDSETNAVDAVKAFNNADGIIITVGPQRKVKIIHGMKDFGNTITRPTSKICGHIGTNDFTFVGLNDYVEDLSFVQYDVPTRTELKIALRLTPCEH